MNSNTNSASERLSPAAGSLMYYEDGCKAIHAKMQAERPTLREYLRQMCAASDKASHEWEAAHPGCSQAAYRNGMWYAYRDIERMLELDAFREMAFCPLCKGQGTVRNARGTYDECALCYSENAELCGGTSATIITP